jgi:hypothetical protein
MKDSEVKTMADAKTEKKPEPAALAEESAKLALLASENEALKKQIQSNDLRLSEIEREREDERAKAVFASAWLELTDPARGLRVLPRERPMLEALFHSLPGESDAEAVVEFADAGGKPVKGAPREVFLASLAAREPIVPRERFSLSASGHKPSFAQSAGGDDPQAMADRRAARARELRDEKKIPMREAIVLADKELGG